MVDPAECPVDGAKESVPLFEVDRYPVRRCVSCGLLFLRPQPTFRELEVIYGKGYFLQAPTGPDEEIFARMKAATAAGYLRELEDYAGRRLKGSRLLEIGCGGGDYLARAKEEGLDVSGIEFNPQGVALASAKVGENRVLRGTVETVDLRTFAPFDACAMFDVIEHVPDPRAFLAKVSGALKPGALLHVVTPSLDSWSAKLLGNRWMEFKPEHLYYFNEKNLAALLEGAGFGKLRVRPNYKILNFQYIGRHMRSYPVPGFSALWRALEFLLPAALARKNFRIVASGMSVIAEKGARP